MTITRRRFMLSSVAAAGSLVAPFEVEHERGRPEPGALRELAESQAESQPPRANPLCDPVGCWGFARATLARLFEHGAERYRTVSSWRT